MAWEFTRKGGPVWLTMAERKAALPTRSAAQIVDAIARAMACCCRSGRRGRTCAGRD